MFPKLSVPICITIVRIQVNHTWVLNRVLKEWNMLLMYKLRLSRKCPRQIVPQIAIVPKIDLEIDPKIYLKIVHKICPQNLPWNCPQKCPPKVSPILPVTICITIARIQVKHTWVLKEWNMSSMYLRVMTITQKRRRKPMLIAIPPRFERKKTFQNEAWKRKKRANFCWSFKVHIFWEGHKILRNLPLTFDCTVVKS